GTVNARAVGWYLGTADVSAQSFTGAGGTPDNIWRSLSDRFTEVKTAFSAQIPFFSSVQFDIGKIARYYNDESDLPPSARNILDNPGEYERNLRSWYSAREEERTGTFGIDLSQALLPMLTGNGADDW